MAWLSSVEGIALLLLLGGIAANFLLALWKPSLLGIGASIGIAAGAVTVFFEHYCFYYRVRCPLCRGKLNAFKNGKNVPRKQAWTQLEKGIACRHCGWLPQVLASNHG